MVWIVNIIFHQGNLIRWDYLPETLIARKMSISRADLEISPRRATYKVGDGKESLHDGGPPETK